MTIKTAYSVPIMGADNPHRVEEVIKGSEFICRIVFSSDVETAKSYVKGLKQSEPDATHHCWAYIVGDPNNTTLIACSDDGEPNGTAGMPMLNVLKHSGLGDVTAVVTRHYGGTKLGTGGLARAYGGSVKLAIQSLESQDRIFTDSLELYCAYDLQQQIEYLLNEHQATITDVQFTKDVAIKAEVPQDQWPLLAKAFEAYQNKNQLKVSHVSNH